MIELKEIENRKYIGKDLVSFEYTIKGLEGPHGETQELRVWFEKVNPQEFDEEIITKPGYKIFTIVEGIVYERIFQMPRSNMNLELVVATGLNQLKWIFQTEAEYKVMLGYTISDIIKDM